LYSSVEASLHCHHQLTFSDGEICTPVITKVNIHVTKKCLKKQRTRLILIKKYIFTVSTSCSYMAEYFFFQILIAYYTCTLKLKRVNFSSLYQIFSVGTKQGNDSNVNLYFTIRFPYFISLTLFLFLGGMYRRQ
jgi:hypothetical protein